MRQIAQKLSLFFVFQVVALCLYAQALDSPLFFDSKSVLQNVNLSQFLQLQRVFSGRWLTELSFGFVSVIFGSSWFYQNLLNVVLHALNACLLFEFLFTLYLTVFRDDSKVTELQYRLMAVVGAVIFLVHPVSVYATAYLIQRSILLGTGLSFLSLILFVRGLRTGNRFLLMMAPLMYLLALMAKENCVMLPGAVVVMLCVCDRNHFYANLKRLAWVFFLYALAASLVIFKKSEMIGTLYEPYVQDMIQTYEQATHSAFDQSKAYGFSILTQCYMFFRYLLVWVLPLSQWMSIDVHFPFAMRWLSFPETLFAILYLGMGLVSIWALRFKSHLKLISAAFLVPMILFTTEFSAVRLSEQFVLYRSYFWMGYLGLAIPEVYQFLRRYVQSLRLVLGLPLGLMLVFFTLANERLQTFQSEVSLWEDALSKVTTDPESPEYFKTHRVHQNLAVAYDVAGDTDKALWHYQQALQIHPNLFPAHDNLGMLYLKLNQPKQALEHFKIAQNLKPMDAENHYNLGVANEALGAHELAIQNYTAAIRLRPDYVEAYNNLSACFIKLNDFPKAKSALEQALSLRPNFVVALFNLGTLYLKINDADKAVEYLQKAKELGMNDEALKNNLKIALQKQLSSH